MTNYTNSGCYQPPPPDPYNNHELEGLTVCVNYGDFLDVSLRHNLSHFQRFVVVTNYNDRETIAVCEKYSVQCVQTDVMYEHGELFNKGLAINLGLAYLRQRGWILHLDTDIVLPDRCRNMLDKHPLDRSVIYGADRVNIHSHEQYKRVLHDNHYPQFHHKFLLDTPAECENGSRLIHREYGYCPIGYFQLWHSSMKRRYPDHNGTCEHVDVLHALQWPRNKRQLLPGLRVFHLESERAKMGINWKGRKTKPFRP